MALDLFASNAGLFDLWTLVHIGTGIVIGLLYIGPKERNLGKAFIIWSLLFIAWEIFELGQPSGGFGGAESGLNLLSDVIMGVLGLGFGAWINRQG